MLFRYDEQGYSQYQRAKIIFILNVVAIIILFFVMVYVILANKELSPVIIISQAAGLVLLICTALLLVKGWFSIAANMLFILATAIIWLTIFFDQNDPVTRLDSIAYILGILPLASLISWRKRLSILIYGGLNILILIAFVYFNHDTLAITTLAKYDYLLDNILSLIFISTLSFHVVTINNRSLSIAESEISERKNAELELMKKNTELEDMNRQYLATMEELEATNEEFESMNEELIASQMDLAESEEKFRLIAEKSQIGIIIAQNERLAYVNQAVADIIGFTIDEMMAWDAGGYSTLIPEDYLKSFMEKARERQQGKIPGGINEEIRMVSKQGDIKWIEINSTTIKFQGHPAELVAVIDITERKKTQEILVQTEKMITIGGLSAGMAHEINNPLGIILHGIQNTLRRLDSDSSKNREKAEQHGIDLDRLKGFLADQNIFSYLTGIQDAGNRASKIVSSMLQFSRSNTGIPEPANIDLVIDKALSIAEKDYDLQKSYDFKKITIEKNFYPELPRITCIETEIEQVLLNLFKNAAQAMSGISQKSYKPLISITTTLQEDSIELIIADNGPGMTEATLNHIFDPFFTTKEIGKGTGLGLSVTFFIITVHHNGKIRASSIPGRGTKFIITLPVTE